MDFKSMPAMFTHAEATRIDLRDFSEALREGIKQMINEETASLAAIQQRINELTWMLQNDPNMQTDLSENAPAQAAKDERSMKVNISNTKKARIVALENELDDYVSTGTITLGTTVELRVLAVTHHDNLNTVIKEGRDTYIGKVVHHATSSSKQHLLAEDSIIGKLIMGRVAGDTIIAQTELGDVTYKIERIY